MDHSRLLNPAQTQAAYAPRSPSPISYAPRSPTISSSAPYGAPVTPSYEIYDPIRSHHAPPLQQQHQTSYTLPQRDSFNTSQSPFESAAIPPTYNDHHHLPPEAQQTYTSAYPPPSYPLDTPSAAPMSSTRPRGRPPKRKTSDALDADYDPSTSPGSGPPSKLPRQRSSPSAPHQIHSQHHLQQPPSLPSGASTNTSLALPALLPPGQRPPFPGEHEGIVIRTKFPVARIKRLVQADEDIGKVAQVTPVVVGRALELFMTSLALKSADAARRKGSKRVTGQHLKETISGEGQFDFLGDVVSKIPDSAAAGASKEGGGGAAEKKGRKGAAGASEEEDEDWDGDGGGKKKKARRARRVDDDSED